MKNEKGVEMEVDRAGRDMEKEVDKSVRGTRKGG